MNYKTSGGSGLRVSPICVGGMIMSDDWGWGAGEAESEEIIKRFMELGGNFLTQQTSIQTIIQKKYPAIPSEGILPSIPIPVWFPVPNSGSMSSRQS